MEEFEINTDKTFRYIERFYLRRKTRQNKKDMLISLCRPNECVGGVKFKKSNHAQVAQVRI